MVTEFERLFEAHFVFEFEEHAAEELAEVAAAVEESGDAYHCVEDGQAPGALHRGGDVAVA